MYGYERKVGMLKLNSRLGGNEENQRFYIFMFIVKILSFQSL